MRSRSLWNKNMEPGLGPFREWNGMGWCGGSVYLI